MTQQSVLKTDKGFALIDKAIKTAKNILNAYKNTRILTKTLAVTGCNFHENFPFHLSIGGIYHMFFALFKVL